MKKYVALLAVLALTCFASVAFAADVTVGGSVDIRSRDFNNLDFDKDVHDNQAYTQERVRIDINAKAGDNLKAKVTIENYWDDWGRNEAPQGNDQTGQSYNQITSKVTGSGLPSDASTKFKLGHLDIREAWVDFMLPGLPVGVKGGHQLLQLGQGWFYRAMLFGADAWLVYAPMGANTLAIVNVKAAEIDRAQADDVDAYVVLDSYKVNDNNTVGIDITNVKDRRGSAVLVGPSTPIGFPVSLYNVGLNYTGKVGPVNLKGELDIQSGEIDTTGTKPKFKGNQIVVQASMPMEALTVNATIARGTGAKTTGTDINQFVPILDANPHYTLIYEYLVKTAAFNYLTGSQDTHTGFANTTAVNVGAGYKLSDSLNVGLNYWFLQATEKIANGVGDMSNKIGSEIDANIDWKLYDNLTWNWALGYFKPGDAFKTASGKTDAATAIQGILSMKF